MLGTRRSLKQGPHPPRAHSLRKELHHRLWNQAVSAESEMWPVCHKGVTAVYPGRLPGGGSTCLGVMIAQSTTGRRGGSRTKAGMETEKERLMRAQGARKCERKTMFELLQH